jgi:hypothetical protein
MVATFNPPKRNGVDFHNQPVKLTCSQRRFFIIGSTCAQCPEQHGKFHPMKSKVSRQRSAAFLITAMVVVPSLCVTPRACAADPKPQPLPAHLEQQSVQALQQAKQKFGAGFRYHREGIIIFISDMDEDKFDFAVKRMTLCAELMWNQFFDRSRVKHPVFACLFRDAQSYQKNCRQFFGGPRGTPAVYNQQLKTLIANMADDPSMPEYGVVIHELVHALMWQELNPPVEWIREGFAAVFEHYTIKDNTLLGLHGYRLERLRRGLAEGNTKPFSQLITFNNG